MVAVAVLGVLLGLAVPTFRELIRNNRIVAQNNDFISSLHTARSEAIKRSSAVTVCASADGATCAGGTTWTTGWILFVDTNTDGALNGAEVVLRQNGTIVPGLTLESTALGAIRYNGMGMLTGPAETFTLRNSDCVSTTGTEARRIDVAVTGRVSTTRVNCS